MNPIKRIDKIKKENQGSSDICATTIPEMLNNANRRREQKKNPRAASPVSFLMEQSTTIEVEPIKQKMK